MWFVDQIKALLDRQEKLYDRQSELKALFEASEGNGDGCSAGEGAPSCSILDYSGSFEWDDRADDVRFNIFGISEYRANQREVSILFSFRDSETWSGAFVCNESYLCKFPLHGLIKIKIRSLSWESDCVKYSWIRIFWWENDRVVLASIAKNLYQLVFSSFMLSGLIFRVFMYSLLIYYLLPGN